MSLIRCVVANCENRYRTAPDVVFFCPFPLDEKERQKWFLVCGLEETLDFSHLHVCARHFGDNDFELHGTSNGTINKSLKIGVVPHLNLVTIKQEPIDELIIVEECDISHRNLPDVTNNFQATHSSKNVDSSLFEAKHDIGNHPNAESIPLEPIHNLGIITIQNTVSSSSYIPSSLPASQSWTGRHEFNISFGPQDKNTKGVAWTYSKIKDKLYVGKDSPCPINFSVKDVLTDDVVIRTMALYSSPENASEVVTRCMNHSVDELNKGIVEAQHLVRCESKSASYEEDQSTKRHSVIVPFENPPVGQQYSTYIYKFACFGSCAGGPNRRPLMLIFSLEKGGQVIGRRKLDVKICACPGRDRKAEEQQVTGEESPPKTSIKRRERETTSLADSFDFTKSVSLPPTKKQKTNSSGPPYYIKVSDKQCYEFLKDMKNFYKMWKTVNNFQPAIVQAMMQNNHRRSDEQDSDSPNENN